MALRLLLDQNLSHKLAVAFREQLGADAVHVSSVGLGRAFDAEVWSYALRERRIIVTKDDDFRQLSVLHGPPPKVVWIALGNCSTREIEVAVVRAVEDIDAFVRDPDAGILHISR